MATGNATIAALKVSLGLDSAQFETGLRDASATMQREARKQAAAADQLAKRVVALKSALDPVYAAQKRVGGQMAEAQALYRAGAISGGEYGRVMGELTTRLKAVSAAQTLVANSQGKAVQSSKSLQQAGLNLTRQFSDVGVSLAGGISPLTVLIQQGPQIADAFQLAKSQGLGFSSVIKGLVGSIGPGTLAIAGFGASVLAVGGLFLSGQKEAAALANTLQITGVNAGLAGKGFSDLAQTVRQETNGSIGEARKVLTDLAATGRFTGEAMGYLATDIIQLSRYTGETSEALTKAFSGMGDDVAGFTAKFTQQYRLITAAQYEHIRLLQDQGRTTEAQIELSKALHQDLAKVAPESLGIVEQAWRSLGNAISGVIEAQKRLGRSSAVDLQSELKSVRSQLGGNYAKYDQKTRDALLARQAELTAKISAAEARAADARTQGEGVAAADRLANKWGDLADNTARARREIQAYRGDVEKLRKANPGSTLIPSAAQQKQTEAAILKRNTPSASGSKGPRDQTDEQLAAATRAELEARQALTRNIQEITGLKVQEIAAELKGQIARVETSKSIDAAQRPQIEQAYRNAAAAKLEAAYRAELTGLIGQQLDAERVLNGYADRIGAAQGALAANAEQQNSAADARLGRQQKFEREEQAYQDGLLVLFGQIDAAEFERRRAALSAALFGEALAQGEQNRVRLVKQSAEGDQAALENQADLLDAQAALVMSGYARKVLGLQILEIEQKIALSKAQEAVDSAKIGSVERQRAEQALATLGKRQAAQKELAKRETALVHGVLEATNAATSFASALKRHDWAGAFNDLAATLQSLAAVSGGNAEIAGLANAASVASPYVALAVAFSKLDAAISKSVTKLLGGDAKQQKNAQLAGSVFGVVGGLIGAAVGGKSSNHGAGIALTPTDLGSVSGSRRDDQTEAAAKATGSAILAGEKLLREAGLTLGTTVQGLVIGTRDLSQIYLSNGQTLTAAVGDAAAAADAALKAVLSNATFVSEAEKSLVESLIAAGKSFDDIAAALQGYAAAQKIAGQLADQILQLTDPKAFDLEAVRRAIDDQKKAYSDLSAEGYLTAEQLAGLNSQLATLEGLQLDAVLKRYTDSLGSAANDNLDLLGQVAGTAADGVRDAYEAFASAKRDEIDSLRQAASGLDSFLRELSTGPAAGRNPVAQLDVLRREFNRLSALPKTDPERLANLQGVSQAFLEASKAASPDELAFRRDLAAVKRATEASRDAAEAQADVGQAQLDVQTSMLRQLGLQTEATLDLAAAVKAYLAAQASLTGAGGNPAALDFDAAKYLAANPDLARNYNSGGSLSDKGTLAEAALYQYLHGGQSEIAAGTRRRGFAQGGSFRVGGHGGIDNQLMQFWASPGEMVSVSHGDPQSGAADEMRGLREQVQILTAGVAQLSGFARRTEKFIKKWDGDGLPAERATG